MTIEEFKASEVIKNLAKTYSIAYLETWFNKGLTDTEVDQLLYVTHSAEGVAYSYGVASRIIN